MEQVYKDTRLLLSIGLALYMLLASAGKGAEPDKVSVPLAAPITKAYNELQAAQMEFMRVLAGCPIGVDPKWQTAQCTKATGRFDYGLWLKVLGKAKTLVEVGSPPSGPFGGRTDKQSEPPAPSTPQ